jgi:DMSO/TMAO reductase YedYZ molybdopterin-dependent catalytic subunit
MANYTPNHRQLALAWVNGTVDRPASFSLAQLKSYPSCSQITQVICEEGWSYIAEWIGLPLSHVLNLVGVHPQARYVVYRCSIHAQIRHG